MKEFRVGFTAGTFDMFHVGHLNLLRAAKEKCEYLIVGVNKDDLVNDYKKKRPLIAEDQRIEIVKGIKFVDEVHLMDNLDKKSAKLLYDFDVVFIGSDYQDSLRYQKEEIEMDKLNVEIVYIPYTIGISSTILAKRIINNEVTSRFYKNELEKASRA